MIQLRLQNRYVSNPESSPAKQGIPKRVFRTWKTLHLDSLHWLKVKKLERKNRDWNFVYFDDGLVDDYMKENWSHHPIMKIFNNCLFPVMKIDIWRLCFAFDLGGCYLDIDSHLKFNLSSRTQSQREIFSFEGNPLHIYLDLVDYPTSNFLSYYKYEVEKNGISASSPILNWSFFARMEHPVLEIAIKELVKNASYFLDKEFAVPHIAIKHFSGPGLLTTAVWKYVLSGGKINIESKDFYDQGVFKSVPAFGQYSKTPHYSKIANQKILGSK